MQAENAQEWTMREKLSSEKLVLERENKRMKNEITRLEDELRERSRPPAAAAVDVDVKILQDELASKTKVFCCICITVVKIKCIQNLLQFSWTRRPYCRHVIALKLVTKTVIAIIISGQSNFT